MKRSMILMIPVYLLALAVASAVCLAVWLVLLIPFLLRPSLVDGVSKWTSQRFTRTMTQVMFGSRRQHANVG